MKRYLLIILLFSLFVDKLQAQDELPNQEKYWRYRQKLVSRMVRVGYGGSGDTCTTCNYATGGYSIPANQLDEDWKSFHFADGPQQLGWYIGVLATEIRLLKNAGQNCEQTKKELLRALQAYDRLDYYCETKQSHGGQPPMSIPNSNGFMMRDDVNKGYLMQHFYLDKNAYFDSDYMAAREALDRNAEKKNVQSKDHIVHLLMGFTLVARCLDDGDESDGVNLKNLAKGQLDRMLLYLKSNDYINMHTNGLVANPTGQDKDNAHIIYYGLATAGERVYNNNFDRYNFFPQGSPRYQSGSLNYLYRPLWDLVPDVSGNLFYPEYTNSFQNLTMAMSGTHGFGLQPVLAFRGYLPCWDWPPFCEVDFYRYHLVTPTATTLLRLIPGVSYLDLLRNIGESYAYELLNLVPIPVSLPNLYVNTTGELLSYGSLYSKTYLQPLLHTYLMNGANPFFPKNHYRGLLNAAPENGTYHRSPRPGFESDGPFGWRVNNRFEKAYSAEYPNGDGIHGEFNGLDYMLLYNLYYLVYDLSPNEYLPKFKPFYDHTFIPSDIADNSTYTQTISASQGIYFGGNNRIVQDMNIRMEAPVINITENFYTDEFSTVTLFGTVNQPSNNVSVFRIASEDTTQTPLDTAAAQQQLMDALIETARNDIMRQDDSLQAVSDLVIRLRYRPICDDLADEDYVDYDVKEKIDLDGTNLLVYPNPTFSTALIMCITQIPGDIKLRISTTMGQDVINQFYPNAPAGFQQMTVDLSNLAAGTYIINVSTSTTVYYGQVIKQ